VICLEGCHGSGKSSLVAQFEQAGYRVLDEAFLDMPKYALHPQSLLMETKWVVSWFERILRLASEDRSKDQPDEVFIADRSPFSAVFYAANGHLLEPLIREQMKEVEAATTIEIHTIHVKVDQEVLWRRIQKRLEAEPERSKYNEGEKSWMLKTLAWYNNFAWDLTVDNSQESPRTPRKFENFEECPTLDAGNEQNDDVMDMAGVMTAVCSLVSDRSKGFRDIYMRRSLQQVDEWMIENEEGEDNFRTISPGARPSLDLETIDVPRLERTKVTETIFSTPDRKVLDFKSAVTPEATKTNKTQQVESTPTSVSDLRIS